MTDLSALASGGPRASSSPAAHSTADAEGVITSRSMRRDRSAIRSPSGRLRQGPQETPEPMRLQPLRQDSTVSLASSRPGRQIRCPVTLGGSGASVAWDASCLARHGDLRRQVRDCVQRQTFQMAAMTFSMFMLRSARSTNSPGARSTSSVTLQRYRVEAKRILAVLEARSGCLLDLGDDDTIDDIAQLQSSDMRRPATAKQNGAKHLTLWLERSNARPGAPFEYAKLKLNPKALTGRRPWAWNHGQPHSTNSYGVMLLQIFRTLFYRGVIKLPAADHSLSRMCIISIATPIATIGLRTQQISMSRSRTPDIALKTDDLRAGRMAVSIDWEVKATEFATTL